MKLRIRLTAYSARVRRLEDGSVEVDIEGCHQRPTRVRLEGTVEGEGPPPPEASAYEASLSEVFCALEELGVVVRRE